MIRIIRQNSLSISCQDNLGNRCIIRSMAETSGNMSLRDELLRDGFPFDIIPSIQGQLVGEKWEITGRTADGRPVRHIHSVAKPGTAEIQPIDSLAAAIAKANLIIFVEGKPPIEDNIASDALIGPGIKLDFTGASPSFRVDRETGDIVGIWGLIDQEH